MNLAKQLRKERREARRAENKQKAAADGARAVHAERMAASEAFVAELARDVYVALIGRGNNASDPGTAHLAMEAAVGYFEALQTFRRPASPDLSVEAEAQRDAEGEAREIALDVARDANGSEVVDE
jgi:hypothetical protein